MSIANHLKVYSPSSVNSFLDYRARWYLEKVKGVKGVESVDMQRGKAVELGINRVYQGMSEDEAIASSLADYDKSVADLDIDEAAEARAPIVELIKCGLEALKPYGKLTNMQRKLWVNQERVAGSHLPWMGYIDYDFEGGVIVDLKVTGRTPSALSAPHARQGSFYHLHTEGTTKTDFVYLIPLKAGCKSVTHTLTEPEKHWNIMLAGMNAMQTIFSNVTEPHLLDAIFTPSPSDFWLNDDLSRSNAREVWSNLV